ncbi:hypothetical protein PENTCL1PPCAC_14531, partial [Pristionchus entomophagus]
CSTLFAVHIGCRAQFDNFHLPLYPRTHAPEGSRRLEQLAEGVDKNIVGFMMYGRESENAQEIGSVSCPIAWQSIRLKYPGMRVEMDVGERRTTNCVRFIRKSTVLPDGAQIAWIQFGPYRSNSHYSHDRFSEKAACVQKVSGRADSHYHPSHRSLLDDDDRLSRVREWLLDCSYAGTRNSSADLRSVPLQSHFYPQD